MLFPPLSFVAWGLLLKRVILVGFHFGKGNKHTGSAFALLIGRDQGKLAVFRSIFELRRVQNDASIVICVKYTALRVRQGPKVATKVLPPLHTPLRAIGGLAIHRDKLEYTTYLSSCTRLITP